MMHSLNLALTKLEGASVHKIEGKDCICIPIEDNRLFVSGRGHIYLGLSMYPYSEGEEKNNNTHYIKRSKPKDISREAYQRFPVIGYGREFGDSQFKAGENNSGKYQGRSSESSNTGNGNPADDLPF